MKGFSVEFVDNSVGLVDKDRVSNLGASMQPEVYVCILEFKHVLQVLCWLLKLVMQVPEGADTKLKGCV